MKRYLNSGGCIIALLFVVLLAGAASAQDATTAPAGSVVGADGMGSCTVIVPEGSDVQVRDVFVISRNGKNLGECMVMSVNGTRITLIAKGNFNGEISKGDTATFARRPAHISGSSGSASSGSSAITYSSGSIPGWFTVSSPDGGFDVQMPGKATESLSPSSDNSVIMHNFQYTDAQSCYLLSYGDLKNELRSEDQKTIFEIMGLAFAKKFGAQLTSNRPVSVGGLPGYEFELTGPAATVRIQMGIRGKRLYQMIVVGQGGLPAGAEQFFSSLVIR